MHGGMTRNELRALMALILLIAVGVGARQVARSRKDGRFWTEITPERNIAVERDVAPLGDGPGERAIHAGLAEEDPKSNPSGTREGGTDDETSATVPGGPGDEAREEAGGPVQEGTAGRVEEAPEGRVDLNAASADDLSALPQIGEKRAAAIIRLREGRGGFSRVEELLDVDGIGEKTLEKIRPFVWVAPRKSRPAGEAQAGSSPSPTATQLPARTPRPTPLSSSAASRRVSQSGAPSSGVSAGGDDRTGDQH